MVAVAGSVIMLGCEHARYGQVDAVSVSPRLAAAISVGADEHSPSLQFKGAVEVPNEDALLAFEDGPVVMLAVADAHFGHESSHQLISGIARLVQYGLPASVEALVEIFATIGAGTATMTESESTLLVAVLDREHNEGFGISYGDSTLALVGPSGFRQANVPDTTYVNADSFLRRQRGMEFEFASRPGDVMVMHTDGVDECHYRNPDSSIRPAHIIELVDRFGVNPAMLATKVAEWALAGVDGNPGGQDNIAVVVASC